MIDWVVPEGLKGSPTPRLETAPAPGCGSRGYEAIEFAHEILGVELMPWQEHFLIRALETLPNGKLRFRTILLIVARQNGKSFVMIILALFYMMVLAPEDTVLGTAQDLTTSEGTWEQAKDLLLGHPELRSMVDGKPSMIRGAKRLRLTTGSEWKVAAAGSAGGRGSSTSLVLMDELREQYNWDAWNATSNTTLTRDSGIVLGVSNAGDSRSVVLRDLRKRAMSRLGDVDSTTLLVEWSAKEKSDPDDVVQIAQADPAVGYKMTWDALRAQRENSTDAAWLTENMGIWITAQMSGPWGEGVWDLCAAPGSRLREDSPLALAVDISLDMSATYIAVAGYNQAGKVHVEVIAVRAGDSWVAPWLDARWEAIGAMGVAVQGRGAASSDLAEVLDHRGLPVMPVIGSELTEAHMRFYQAVRDGVVAHLGQPPLDLAAAGAALKYVSDGRFLIDKRKSQTNSAPLVAVALAYGYLTGSIIEKEESVSAYDDEFYQDQGEGVMVA